MAVWFSLLFFVFFFSAGRIKAATGRSQQAWYLDQVGISEIFWPQKNRCERECTRDWQILFQFLTAKRCGLNALQTSGQSTASKQRCVILRISWSQLAMAKNDMVYYNPALVTCYTFIIVRNQKGPAWHNAKASSGTPGQKLTRLETLALW